MSLLDQSGVTGGGLDPYNVHALFVNMDNMWTERFGNFDCLVSKEVGTKMLNQNQLNDYFLLKLTFNKQV